MPPSGTAGQEKRAVDRLRLDQLLRSLSVGGTRRATLRLLALVPVIGLYCCQQ